MLKATEIKALVEKTLRDAQKIARDAERAGRKLTDDEAIAVSEAIVKSKQLRTRYDEAVDHEELQKQMEGDFVPARTIQDGGSNPFAVKFRADFDAAVRNYAQRKDASITGDLSLAVGGPPVEIPTEPTIAGLLAQASLDDSDGYSYLKEGVATIGAAPVAKGAAKPPTDVAVSREEGKVQTIAHIVDAINQADLDDESFLRDLIRKIGFEGLLAELDDQILNGNGTPPNLAGILGDGDVQSTPFSSDALTTLREAKKDLRLVNEAPTAVLMHPDDAAALDELRDEAQFLIGNAGTPDAPFGVRRVESTKIESGTALMGNFAKARLYTRSGIRILEDPYAGLAGDNYSKNKVDFRFEGRYGLAVLRGQAFTIVDLGAGS